MKKKIPATDFFFLISMLKIKLALKPADFFKEYVLTDLKQNMAEFFMENLF